MTKSLTRQLYAVLSRSIAPDDRRRAVLHVIDWIGCATIGAQSPAGATLTQVNDMFGGGPCRIIGRRETTSAAGAAFANGALGNVLEMDDIHRTSILHPGPVVIPAVLAASQAFDLSATAFLDGIIRGYEALIRIGRSVGPGHYAKWHNTSSCGPFGAAAGVAFALGLDEEQFVSALGNAGSTASGLWRCRHEPVMTKQWHTARAAEDGLAAALLAQRGLTGPQFILEGEQGFYAATAPDADPDAVIADPDGPWLIYDTSFKPWAACRHAHAAIDAALAVRAAGMTPDAIAALTIETYGDAARFCDRQTPTSEIEAKFSLQHAAAITLINGEPGLDDFGAERRADAAVAALRDRMSVRVTEAFDTAYPQHYGSAIALRLQDGRQRRFSVPDALGDPARPLTDDAIIAKARALLDAAGSRQDAADVIAAGLSLADWPDMTRFSASLP